MKTELTTEDRERIEQEAAKLFNRWDGGLVNVQTMLLSIAEYATLFERQQQKELETRIHELESLRNELVSNQLGHRLELKEIEKEFEAERSELSNLLAIMYGDGGHHEQKVGTKQAIIDVIELLHKKWVTNEMLYDINELRNKVIEECIDIVTDYNDPNPLILERLNALKTK